MFMRGATSVVEFINTKDLVKKSIGNNSICKIYNNVLSDYYSGSVLPVIQHEVAALQALEKYDFTPKVVDVKDKYFIMTFCGSPVMRFTIFDNLECRVTYILECMEKGDVSHNDIFFKTFRNCTVLNYQLYLVDFQLANVKDIRPYDTFKKVFKRKDTLNDRDALNRLVRVYRDE